MLPKTVMRPPPSLGGFTTVIIVPAGGTAETSPWPL